MIAFRWRHSGGNWKCSAAIGHQVLGLPALIENLADPGADLSRAVALTVDDGYHDFADLAADVFLAYDCPVTSFVTTGFLDGRVWMWWDQVDYCLAHAGRPTLSIEVAGEVLQLDLRGPERAASALCLWTALKRVSTADRIRLTAELAARLDLTIPDAPPADCRPMQWNDVRSLSRRGLRFAPHTVTHPVLSRSPDGEAAFEIEESWRRVGQEEPTAEPVFAYPHGMRSRFLAGACRAARAARSSGGRDDGTGICQRRPVQSLWLASLPGNDRQRCAAAGPERGGASRSHRSRLAQLIGPAGTATNTVSASAQFVFEREQPQDRTLRRAPSPRSPCTRRLHRPPAPQRRIAPRC